MKTTLENKTLTVYLADRIDTTNAKKVEAELFAAVDENEKTADSIVLDMKDLVYISSSGLRVLLKLRKSKSIPVKVVNVSNDIYEIFEVTGFTEILDIEK